MSVKQYLVAGCAGFIGWAVSRQLLAAGHQVIGFDILSDAYDVRLKQWRVAQLEKCEGFSWRRADISDTAAMDAIGPGLPKLEAVINLAGSAGVRRSVEVPHEYIRMNTLGTLNLLELCRKQGIRKFIVASTSSLYGANNPMPYREDADTSYPLSPYAASKKGAEAMTYAYHVLHHIDVTIFRYFTVYGPAGRPDMSVFRFVQWISEGKPIRVFGDGTQSRDFTYIEDIARGTISALGLQGYQIINLGSDRPVKLLDVIGVIERCTGKPAHLVFEPQHPADMAHTWADISKARALLGWSPETDYEVGLGEAVTWYQANRVWARDIQVE